MNKKVAIILSLCIFILIQGYCLLTVSPKHALEGGQAVSGDFQFYLEGAKSIHEFYAIDKFNNKKQPILGSPIVELNQLRKHSSIIAALYPYPSFKFGYSLTAGILTLPIKNDFFKQHIPRLSLVNFFCSFILLIIVINIVNKLYNSSSLIIIFTLFYSLDIFNISNNYIYQSHTIVGLMYSLAAYLLYINNKEMREIKFLFIPFLLVLSLISSSHSTFFTIPLGILILTSLIKNLKTFWLKLRYTFIWLIGLSIWPIYILSVEFLLNFKEIGLPTFLNQNLEYINVINLINSTYTFSERIIYDLRIWNTYILYIFLILFVFYVICNNYCVKLNIDFKKFKIDSIYHDKVILFLPIVIFIISSIFLSLPIVRAITPQLFFLDILLSIVISSIFFRLIGLKKYIFIASIIFLLLLNLTNYIAAVKTDYIISYLNTPPKKIIKLKEKEKIWQQVDLFHKNQGRISMPQGELGNYSLSLNQYLALLSTKYNQDIGKSDYWVEVNPLDLVEQYSHTRRFKPQFNPNRDNIVDLNTIKKDFKLFFELFDCINEFKKDNTSYITYDISSWNPSFFDQEYNYIYGYNSKISGYLVGTSMDSVDMRKIYYFKISTLYKSSCNK